MCTRKGAWLLLCCLIFGGCSRAVPAPDAKANTAGGPPLIDANTWESFRPANAGFIVMLLGKPADLSMDSDSTIHGVQLSGGAEYAVSWADHSSEVAKIGAEAALEVARDAQVLLQDNELLKDEPRQVQGHPARDVVSIDTDGYVIHCRMIMAGDRLYQLAYVTAKANYSPTDKNLAKFLDSFELSE